MRVFCDLCVFRGRVSSCDVVIDVSAIEQCVFSVYSRIQHALRGNNKATHLVTKIATTQRGCAESYQNQR